ncbi:hypothetical protein CPB84DRAFT_1849519 [Gymnopilus junonius]|uniref:Uncharacterized protein n=1 Tax=Gymnopilus junonius TaxID=109634 RepID=A0A9P5NKB9_GYMJU|nr:hypothetical protein CPB84DRAFT_1849519 [Gymnopilus junonius]
MSSLPVTAEAFEAMRMRIIELEDQLAQQPSAKRARTSHASYVADGATPAVAGTSASSGKTDEKKSVCLMLGSFLRLKKGCKSDAVKFQGSPKTIKIEQPTPTNKPKSVVTIIHFASQAHIDALFGDELEALQGNMWSRGDVPQRTFWGGFGGFGLTFSKSQKLGAVDVDIRSIEVNYSKNNMKCSLKFEVIQQRGGETHNDYDDDD